jgi:hypothetical protein
MHDMHLADVSPADDRSPGDFESDHRECDIRVEGHANPMEDGRTPVFLRGSDAVHDPEWCGASYILARKLDASISTGINAVIVVLMDVVCEGGIIAARLRRSCMQYEGSSLCRS